MTQVERIHLLLKLVTLKTRSLSCLFRKVRGKISFYTLVHHFLLCSKEMQGKVATYILHKCNESTMYFLKSNAK